MPEEKNTGTGSSTELMWYMGLSRRQLLRTGIAGSYAALLGTGAASSRVFPGRRLGDPFSLGVASGDPAPDGVVLWTRLAPDPLAPEGTGGMTRKPVTVEYEVAADEGFQQVVQRGSTLAVPELAHSVHPEVHGLQPDRWYFYRFRAGSAISPVGRTHTAPALGSPAARLRFAFASCQAWNDGYYTAYEHLAAEDLDLVIHLGDYIYENALAGGWRGVTFEPRVRQEARDLTGYRLHYAVYKLETALQQAHAAFPWIITMDDHEVADDWAAGSPGSILNADLIPAVFRRRRTAAFRAMYEHQPLRLAQFPSGPDIRMHRRFQFGTLADVTLLDTRQYRTRQACNPRVPTDCVVRFASNRTILGAAQRDWLIDGLRQSRARWRIIGNQVVMGRTDEDPAAAEAVSTEAWDGYVADRNAVLGAAAALGVQNLVVITGDRHENYAADLRRDFSDPESPVVASEFTGTSVTSGGDGVDMYERGQRLLAINPDLKFFNGQRGYVRVELDESLWRSDFRVVPFVRQRGAPIFTRASYVVEDQRPGVRASHEGSPGPGTAATAAPGQAAEVNRPSG